MKAVVLYNVEPILDSENLLYFHERLTQSLQIVDGQEIILSYGKRTCSVKVKTHSLQGEYLIYMSEDIINTLLIDTAISYEASFLDNQLIIGPVIGLLLGKTEARLKKHLRHYLVYTLLYKEINGLLFVYCEEQIDFSNKVITGYVYDENTPSHWRKGTLPFPSASFRRAELSPKAFNSLTEMMGRSLFNSRYFDKWHFWNWISPVEELKWHLPETTNVVNLASLNRFIEKYGGVYLKPRNGSRGKGIYYIEKEKDQYKWMKNYDDDIKYWTSNELENHLRRYKFYLLQQPILLQSYENRKVDYRVLLQKNETGRWQCTGMIARFGKANAISSNFKANGFALEGTEALKLQFGYDDISAFQKYQEIVYICTNMACQIEKEGAYADLGIDVGIDKDEKVWVIEVNKRHDHDFPLMIKNKKMYFLVKSNPVLYAKYIAMGGCE